LYFCCIPATFSLAKKKIHTRVYIFFFFFQSYLQVLESSLMSGYSIDYRCEEGYKVSKLIGDIDASR
jgi:hypothetical protein